MEKHEIKNQVKNGNYIIKYDDKYMPKAIIESLIEVGGNYHLVKDRTGAGATHGILNITNKKIILVAPTRQLVIDKELDAMHNKFPGSTKFDFIYGNSYTSLKDVVRMNDDRGHVIMCTIDQALYLKRTELHDYTLIIDELHLMVMGSLYRKALGDDLINFVSYYKEHSSVITITATPLFNYPNVFDIDFTQITVKNSKYTNNNILYHTHEQKHFEGDIQKNIINGENVIVFSNDADFLINIAKFLNENKIQYKKIVGQRINIKMVSYLGVNSYDVPTVWLCSSAGMEGVDIKCESPVIYIHNKINSDYGMFTPQNIVQALGRARNGYKYGVIYYDDTVYQIKKNDRVYKNQIQIDETTQTYKTAIKELGDANQMLIKDLDKYLNRFNIEYMEFNTIIEELFEELKNKQLTEIVTNILNIGVTEFNFLIQQVLNDIYVNTFQYGFSEKVSIGWLIAGIVRENNLNWDEIKNDILTLSNGYENNRDEISKLINILSELKIIKNYKLEKKNDMDGARISKYLYNNNKNSGTILNSNNNKTVHMENTILKNHHPYDYADKLYIYYLTNYPKSKVLNKIKKIIEDKSNEISDYKKTTIIKIFNDEIKKYKKIVKKTNGDEMYHNLKIIQGLNFILNKIEKERKSNINKNDFKDIIKEVLKGINQVYITDELSDFIINFDGIYIQFYKTTELKRIKNNLKQFGLMYINEFKKNIIIKDFREFSPITALPMDVQNIVLPYVTEIDIRQANPRFLHILLNKEDFDVYEKIRKIYKITRKEAKVRFNTFINATNDQIDEISKRAFFLTIGYTNDEIDKILQIGDKRGKMYKEMTRIEEQVIEQLKMTLMLGNEKRTIRRHDSIMIYSYNNVINDANEFTFEYLHDNEEQHIIRIKINKNFKKR